jgi:hypothetical protein
MIGGSAALSHGSPTRRRRVEQRRRALLAGRGGALALDHLQPRRDRVAHRGGDALAGKRGETTGIALRRLVLDGEGPRRSSLPS